VEETVRVRHVRKDYGDLRALDDVSFSVARGEVFGLVGPKGSGKTTMMEILRGARARCDGEVSVLGVDPEIGGRTHRARIGVVAQESAHDGSCTPRDLVRRRAATYVRSRPVDEVLDMVGLEDRRDVRIATLSLGEQRRSDLAAALIGGPELLFLDEPATAFDPESRRDVAAVVKALGATGTTVVFATNRVAEARRFADRVGVLAGGEMIAVAPPDELADHSGSERGIIRFRLPEHVAGCDLPDAGHLLTIGLDRMVELRSASPLRDLQWLTRWAVERDVPLDDLTIVPPSFEETYLELIGQA
jgi:ABC-2 type transport system ATP-binding protein